MRRSYFQVVLANQGGMQSETWVYDVKEDAWKAASAQPDGKCKPSLTYVGGRVWAMSE